MRPRVGHKNKVTKWVRSLLDAPKTSSCIDWPFYKMKNGYGQYRGTSAHRVILLLSSPPDDLSLQAAHSCGNRLCVNPEHLSWKSQAQNEKDKYIHGTSKRGLNHHNAKLSIEDVLTIRKGGCKHRLAKAYGVTPNHIKQIQNRRRWKHV